MTLRDLFEMDGRVAVVTGSGQGIGRAIALGLADFGCDVVLNSRRVRDLEVTATEIERRGRSVLIVQGDIRDFSETLPRLFRDFPDTFPRLSHGFPETFPRPAT